MTEVLDSKDKIVRLNEADLRTHVIIPILLHLGFRDVYHNHGINELGKDIVAWSADPLGTPLNTVVVAKAGKISGKINREVADQVNAAFNTPFRTGVDNSERYAHTVRIVTSGAIPSTSKDQILSHVDRTKHHQIVWIDGDGLWKLWCVYYPIDALQLSSRLQSLVSKYSDEAIEVSETISPTSRRVAFWAKNPALLTSGHTHGKIHLQLTETTGGQAVAQALDDHRKTGGALTLSSRDARIELPPLLERVAREYLGMSGDDFDQITITPLGSEKSIPVGITVACADGDTATLEYIDLRLSQAGTDLATLTNDRQDYPIKFSLVVPNEPGQGKYGYSLASDRISAHTTIKWMDMQRCLRKPGQIKVKDLISGVTLLNLSHTPDSGTEPYEDEAYDFYTKMSEVENTLGRPLYIPSEGNTDEDEQTFRLLLQLLENPVIHGTRNGGNMEAFPLDEDPGMNQILTGEPCLLSYETEGVAALHGEQIRLGTVKYVIDDVRLADPERARRELETAAGTSETIQLHLVPGTSNHMQMTYLAWRKNDASA